MRNFWGEKAKGGLVKNYIDIRELHLQITKKAREKNTCGFIIIDPKCGLLLGPKTLADA